jgi:flagellar hook-length control protein FliK
MESIPAAALAVVVATEAQPLRDATIGDVGDFSTFGQALEKEISVVSGELADAPANLPAAAFVGVDVAARSDGTQILDVILDSTGMLASAAAAAASAATQLPDTVEPRADPGIEATGEAVLKAARTSRLADYIRSDARPELPAGNAGTAPVVMDAGTAKSEAAAATTDMLVEAPGIAADAHEQRSPVSRVSLQPQQAAAPAAASVASPDKVLEAMRAMPSAGRGATSETLAPLEKTLASTNTPDRPRVQASSPGTAREEPKTRSLSDDVLAPRIELRSERTALEAPPISGTTVSAPAPDLALQPREVTVSLDTLSSSALMHRATAVPHHATATSATPAVVRVDTPLAAPGWNEAFRQQVVWLVDRQLETAELHVNPPHLGPVEVVLKLTDDGARIAFCSPHAAVRDAIEASLAELRSGLAERGLALGEALVSADPGSAREQMMRDENVREAPRTSDAAQNGGEDETRAQPLRRGLVDTFV